MLYEDDKIDEICLEIISKNYLDVDIWLPADEESDSEFSKSEEEPSEDSEYSVGDSSKDSLESETDEECDEAFERDLKIWRECITIDPEQLHFLVGKTDKELINYMKLYED